MLPASFSHGSGALKTYVVPSTMSLVVINRQGLYSAQRTIVE
jgi:hypothetical protein